MNEELDVPTADMLEIVAGGGNGVEYVNLPWLLESAAKELRTVIRERDEARAEAKRLRKRLGELDADEDAGDWLYKYEAEALEAKAEARGYQRGKEDAEIAGREVLLPLKREQAQTLMRHAEAQGYRRGVQDAIAAGDKMAQNGTYGWVWLRAAILALLEQTEPGEKK